MYRATADELETRDPARVRPASPPSASPGDVVTALPGRLVLLGHPVAHSLSPALPERRAARAPALPLALRGARRRARRARRDAARRSSRQRAAGNVTIPHKEARRARCVRRLTPLAERVGAVNTFWRRGRRARRRQHRRRRLSTRSRCALLGASRGDRACRAARRRRRGGGGARRARSDGLGATCRVCTRATRSARARSRERFAASRDVVSTARRGARRRDAGRERDAGRARRDDAFPVDVDALPPGARRARPRLSPRRDAVGARGARARPRAADGLRCCSSRGRWRSSAGSASSPTATRCGQRACDDGPLTTRARWRRGVARRCSTLAPARRVLRRLRARCAPPTSASIVCGACWARAADAAASRSARGAAIRDIARHRRCRWCDAAAAVRARRALGVLGPGGAAARSCTRSSTTAGTRAATAWRERMARARTGRSTSSGARGARPVPLVADARARARLQPERAARARRSRRAGAFRCGRRCSRDARHDDPDAVDTRGALRNVAGAFRVARAIVRRAARRHLVLVDDVVTTAATLNACAAALCTTAARASSAT